MSKSFFKKILMLLCVLTLAGCYVFFVIFFGDYSDDFFLKKALRARD